ncbi:MAG: hypothetical protein QGH45_04495, partial [Myxococcota bacterium]|nr:hypothetical protein [Myxococcota bacterium]
TGDDDDDLFDLDSTGLVRVRTLTGEDEFEAAGWSVAIGDLTGEGIADLVVGAPRHEASGQTDAGRFYWLRGEAGGLSQASQLSMANLVVDGDHADQWLGTAMSIPGDIDNDGIDDLCVICLGDGELWIFAGSQGFSELTGPTARLTGLALDDEIGSYLDASDVVGPAGDLDGDGSMELLVGEPAAGRVWLLPGRFYSGEEVLAAEARASFEGVEFGYAVLGGLDVGGGSGTDIVIGGAPMYDVAIFLDDLWGVGIPQGTFTAESTLLDAPDVDFGRSLTALGDLTGDGLDDFAVGAHGDPPDHQRAYIYAGRASWAGDDWDSHLATFDGPTEGWVGKVVLGSIDMDADGSPELALGDPHAGSGATLGGAFYLVEADDVDWDSSPALDHQHPAVHSDTGTVPDDLLGWSLAAGDLDGDGADELVVGAPATYAGDPGAVRIYSLGSW